MRQFLHGRYSGQVLRTTMMPYPVEHL